MLENVTAVSTPHNTFHCPTFLTPTPRPPCYIYTHITTCNNLIYPHITYFDSKQHGTQTDTVQHSLTITSMHLHSEPLWQTGQNFPHSAPACILESYNCALMEAAWHMDKGGGRCHVQWTLLVLAALLLRYFGWRHLVGVFGEGGESFLKALLCSLVLEPEWFEKTDSGFLVILICRSIFWFEQPNKKCFQTQLKEARLPDAAVLVIMVSVPTLVDIIVKSVSFWCPIKIPNQLAY